MNLFIRIVLICAVLTGIFYAPVRGIVVLFSVSMLIDVVLYLFLPMFLIAFAIALWRHFHPVSEEPNSSFCTIPEYIRESRNALYDNQVLSTSPSLMTKLFKEPLKEALETGR